MRSIFQVVTLISMLLLTACGGGGGDTGTTSFGTGSGSGTGSTSGGTTATASYVLTVDVQRTGSSTSAINSTETVQAVATVVSKSGDPVPGVVVTFSETGPSLVAFAPVAATALTDASGRAVVDLSAVNPSGTGATTVTASATVASTTVTSSKSIQIAAGAVTSGTPAVPAAINFVGSTPSGTAIVVKGSGGNGRSESAILTFKIVDATGAPINAAKVDFIINSDNGGATIQPPTAVSNSDGLVTSTVASGMSPASIVVKASANSKSGIKTQSDTLIVSNAVTVSGGFEIAAEKYNLDGHRIGDSTTITAYARDEFGNLVADGVAVSFRTDYGAVGSSTLGGCTTVNGRCSVQFYVQAPRDISIATVVATVRVNSVTTLTDRIKINMAGSNAGPYLALDKNGIPLTQIRLTSCKEVQELLLSDGLKNAPAAGTAIASTFASTGVTVAVKTGSPVLDQLQSDFPPVPFGIEIDLTGSSLAQLCIPIASGGVVNDSTAFITLEFKTPGGLVYSQRISLAYPQK